jgi:ferric-dicitrate binding protein FerR (iron transport regulator)
MLDSINNKQPKWIDNISSFKGVPLSEVLDEFERQYGIEVEVIKVDTERIFTGSFVNNNLEQALASITIPFNLTFKKDNSNKITLFKNQQ